MARPSRVLLFIKDGMITHAVFLVVGILPPHSEYPTLKNNRLKAGKMRPDAWPQKVTVFQD